MATVSAPTSPPITASMLYDLVSFPHRVAMDLFANPAEHDTVSPFVQLLWERGGAHEKQSHRRYRHPVRRSVHVYWRREGATHHRGNGRTGIAVHQMLSRRSGAPKPPRQRIVSALLGWLVESRAAVRYRTVRGSNQGGDHLEDGLTERRSVEEAINSSFSLLLGIKQGRSGRFLSTNTSPEVN